LSERAKPTSFTESPLERLAGWLLFLGIDGGGTGTEASVMNTGGEVLGRGRGGPSNINYVSERVFAESLAKAVSEALEEAGISIDEVAGACLALAGAGGDNPEKIRHAAATVLGPCPFIVVEDTYAALAAAHEGSDGIVLIAGTGSNCLGVKGGRYASAGGYGALLGDEGSAYSIALKGMRAALRSEDGRDEATVLTKLLLEGTGVKKARDFVHLTLNLDRPGIAALSKYVFQAADEFGDDLALQILQEEAYALADMARAVARRLNLSSPKVAARGGCFKNGIYLFQLELCLRDTLPESTLVPAPRPASEGAALLTQQHFLKGTGSR
jgi:N-acetylmuramic acid 6-phosphate etherase